MEATDLFLFHLKNEADAVCSLDSTDGINNELVRMKKEVVA
jgi:hypothetical protein